jgi:hypothetical protein
MQLDQQPQQRQEQLEDGDVIVAPAPVAIDNGSDGSERGVNGAAVDSGTHTVKDTAALLRIAELERALAAEKSAHALTAEKSAAEKSAAEKSAADASAAQISAHALLERNLRADLAFAATRLRHAEAEIAAAKEAGAAAERRAEEQRVRNEEAGVEREAWRARVVAAEV